MTPRTVWSLAAAALLVPNAWAQTEKPLRPAAVPLVTHDPYFSVWSPADRLTDADTVHWTGAPQRLQGLLRVDGKTYRVMGIEPKQLPALPQTQLAVLPTRTIYEFANPQVRLTLTFTTPALPASLEVLSRPLTYLSWDVASADSQEHAVELYVEVSGELAVNVPQQVVAWTHQKDGELTALRIGTVEQPVLQKRGDNLRIDWGHIYLAAASDQVTDAALAPAAAARAAFVSGKALPADDRGQPRAVADDAPVAAMTMTFGRVGPRPAGRRLMLAYDDQWSIEYFRRRLRPYWRRDGMDIAGLLAAAHRDYPRLAQACRSFDDEMLADLRRRGGNKFAEIAALAWRQAIAANKLTADAAGMPLWFSKENFSNGCIATVDILYPHSPQLLLCSPALLKALLIPVLDYASSPRWPFPFAPHDLGTYPKANGQVYGGGEQSEEGQMPVEESGNMLLLLAALAKAEGNAAFADRYWPLLTRWAEYLRDKGLDPENQLCTDDFAGHLAHNVNLSAKALLALAAYGELCRLTERDEAAALYRRTAEQYARTWIERAADGDHTRLAFDAPGTWSQKYNLVWDRILGFNLFPAEVVQREIAYYRKMQNAYGLPLDNRKTYTKLDWTVWSATMARDRGDFEALIARSHAFVQATPDRVPLTDWHWTLEPKQRGFQARSVVGGVYMPLLTEADVWKKWVARGEKVAGPWAPLVLPKPGVVVVPAAKQSPAAWRYVTGKPAADWFRPDFDDAGWKQGPGGFGRPGMPRTIVNTRWDTPQIWLRRQFTLARVPANPRLLLHHDEDAEVYINGLRVLSVNGYVRDYDEFDLSAEAAKALKPGVNVLAITCRQTKGGQYIDAGIIADE